MDVRITERMYVTALGLARTSGWNGSGFYYRCDETFCIKWKRAHGQLFHCNVIPNATCFIFCAVRCPHSGWWWQWNMKELTCLGARRVKQPHGYQSSSAVPSNCNIVDLDFEIFYSERLITSSSSPPPPSS
jgi:hypothetical protein